MWWLIIEQQMQQLRLQNSKFDDCRLALSIDKKNLDKVSTSQKVIFLKNYSSVLYTYIMSRSEDE